VDVPEARRVLPAMLAGILAGVLLLKSLPGPAMLAALGLFVAGYGLAGLPQPAQVWEKTLRLARWGKAGARPSETPREFASRLRDLVPGTEEVGYLAAAYERSTFGQKQISEDESERLELAWRNVRNRLLRRVLRWRG